MNQKAESLFSLLLSVVLLLQFKCEVRVYDVERYAWCYFTVIYL
jgi:hypothetical protein